jgi:hypothetical protein
MLLKANRVDLNVSSVPALYFFHLLFCSSRLNDDNSESNFSLTSDALKPSTWQISSEASFFFEYST